MGSSHPLLSIAAKGALDVLTDIHANILRAALVMSGSASYRPVPGFAPWLCLRTPSAWIIFRRDGEETFVGRIIDRHARARTLRAITRAAKSER